MTGVDWSECYPWIVKEFQPSRRKRFHGAARQAGIDEGGRRKGGALARLS